MSEKNSLGVPPAAKRDAKSFEILRVWIAEQNQHISLGAETWDDPFTWGIFLADLARHVANAQKQMGKTRNIEAFLDRLQEGFEAEMEEPTDEVDGSVQ